METITNIAKTNNQRTGDSIYIYIWEVCSFTLYLLCVLLSMSLPLLSLFEFGSLQYNIYTHTHIDYVCCLLHAMRDRETQWLRMQWQNCALEKHLHEIVACMNGFSIGMNVCAHMIWKIVCRKHSVPVCTSSSFDYFTGSLCSTSSSSIVLLANEWAIEKDGQSESERKWKRVSEEERSRVWTRISCVCVFFSLGLYVSAYA